MNVIFTWIAILAITASNFSGYDFSGGQEEIFQAHDGKKSHEILEGGENNCSVVGYKITDSDGKTLLKGAADDFIYIADNGYLVRIKDGRDENGGLKYVGSTIIKQEKENIFIPDVGLFPFGEYFVGCLYLTDEIKGIYDYNGHIVLKPSDEERIIAVDDRLYIVTKDFTKILDNGLNVMGQADFEVSKRMLQNMYWNIKGINYSDCDNKEKYGLIFEKNGLSGICDMDLNILIEAKYSNIVYHTNRFFELRDKEYKTIAEVFLYKDGTFAVKTKRLR